MGGILTRRPLMAAASGGGDPLIYSLESTAVSNGDYIPTGVYPLAGNAEFTILFDMTVTQNPTSSGATSYTFISAGNGWDKLGVFKPSTWNANIRAKFCGSSTNQNSYNLASSSAGRFRFAITHAASSDTARIQAKKDNGSVVSFDLTGTFSADQTAELSFGRSSTSEGLPPGTINSAKVYDVVLPADEIDAFFA